MNLIETRTIGKVILNEQTPRRMPRVEHFLIPYYQRGYRWERIHVSALLDDIDNFINSGEENYCLQPIVISPGKDSFDHDIWEVIDGQQRLITLNIIFGYIQKPRYKIIFENRTKSTAFLENLSPQTYNHDDPDFHFLSIAHEVVSKWFDIKTENDISYIDQFYTSVTRNAQLIWYQLDNLLIKDKIDTFNRFNVGKIPLTNAELIRALILSKIKTGKNEREDILRQGEISSEWNTVEHELQKHELWYFLNNQSKTDYSSRIEYLFDLIANHKEQDYSTYLWFEKQIKNDDKIQESENAFKLWSQTMSLFAKLKSWYHKRTLYHYVGFLLADHYPIEKILENAEVTKPVFEKWLTGEITARLEKIDLKKLYYKHPDLETILLLFNVMTVEALDGDAYNRFPFNLYKKVKYEGGGWSIEHIHAQQSEPLKDEKAIRSWLEQTLTAIKEISFIEADVISLDETGRELVQKEKRDVDSKYFLRLQKMLESDSINQDEFNLLREEIIRLFDSSSVHELENLALLSKRDNSTLNNAIFPVKRNRIIALEKNGRFIPPCTRNLFLKFYSNSTTQPYYWSSADKREYFNVISEILNPFLTLKENRE